jgi:hypothetical protein
MGALNLIKDNTSEDSVILAFPNNLVNRYIPYFTKRYVFTGSNFISKDHQWQVLSFCNGPFAQTCLDRLNLADKFYKQPTIETLELIKQKYKVDYLLIDSQNLNEINIINNFLGILPIKSVDKRHWLYKI